MNDTQLITNITENQGIAIAVIGERIEDSATEFCQYAGRRENCESFNPAKCSRDGLLWGSNDMGSPYFCTRHAFPQEQLGYEFVKL